MKKLGSLYVLPFLNFRPGLALRVRHAAGMAKSKFEYTKKFEADDRCLQNCWIVVRVDGKSFHRFSEDHQFEKPNDSRALELMTHCAKNVMKEMKPIVLAYGQSDEYSFVFRKDCDLYNRRASKLATNVCSLFTASYVYHWTEHFPCTVLRYPPSFDGRVVLYPTDRNLRDYLSWRQADCHINNLYNTAFWTLVLRGGLTVRRAEERLRGTQASEKNEILFSQFGINYNNLPELYRKGTVIIREKTEPEPALEVSKTGSCLVATNVDIIGESFWNQHAEIMEKS